MQRMVAEHQSDVRERRAVECDAAHTRDLRKEAKLCENHPGRRRSQIIIARQARGPGIKEIPQRLAHHLLRPPWMARPVIDPRVPKTRFIADRKIHPVLGCPIVVVAEIIVQPRPSRFGAAYRFNNAGQVEWNHPGILRRGSLDKSNLFGGIEVGQETAVRPARTDPFRFRIKKLAPLRRAGQKRLCSGGFPKRIREA